MGVSPALVALFYPRKCLVLGVFFQSSGVFFSSSGLLFIWVVSRLVGRFNRVQSQLIGIGAFSVGQSSERAFLEKLGYAFGQG